MSTNRYPLSITYLAVMLALLVPTMVLAGDCPCTIENAVNTTSVSLGDSTDVEFWQAQTFVAGGDGVFSGFKVRFNASVNSPTGNVGWGVYGDNLGGPGLLIGSGSFAPVVSSENTIAVSNGPLLNGGGLYWLVLSVDPQGTNNRYTIGRSADATNPYTGGSRYQSQNSGVSWTVQTSDLYFVITIGALSATATPTTIPDTPTPADTATPTQTLTPTPNYNIEITATSGAPMKLERSATYGDLASFGASLIVAGVLFFMFVHAYWRDRSNA